MLETNEIQEGASGNGLQRQNIKIRDLWQLIIHSYRSVVAAFGDFSVDRFHFTSL